MRKWEEDKNRLAHVRKLKNARSSIDSNLRPNKPKKSANVKNSKTPFYTQKYFQADMAFQNNAMNGQERRHYEGKNLFGGANDVQGGAVIDEGDSFMNKTHSKMNSSHHSMQTSFLLGGPIERINNLPIFKLLQAFKLQQYAKKFADIGYGYEVYKIALLLPRERHDLLSKLNLMPGHRARFLSLFEIIDQIYPRDEKFKMLKKYKKSSRAKISNGAPTDYKANSKSGVEIFRDSTSGSSKRRKNLMKYYKQLDKQSKKEVNEHFIK